MLEAHCQRWHDWFRSAIRATRYAFPEYPFPLVSFADDIHGASTYLPPPPPANA